MSLQAQDLMLGFLLALLCLLLVSFCGEDGIRKTTYLHQRIQQQIVENEELKRQNMKLTREVLDVRNSVDVIEEIAREDLGMIKEGETFHRIINHQSRTDIQP